MTEPSAASPATPAPGAPAPRRRRRPLSRGRKLLFVSILAGLGLLTAELLMRLVGPADPVPAFTPHPYLRHVRTPNSNQVLTNPRTQQTYTIHIDAHGFRASRLPPPGQPKPPGEYRIFFVGGSTTENIAVSDEESFPVRVERALNEGLPGAPVLGINTAIAGNSIVDSFSLVAHRLTALQPDAIVILHAINDMRIGCSERFDPSHYEDRRPLKAPRLSEFFSEYSKLYRTVQLARDRASVARREERYRERGARMPYSQGVDPSRGLPHFLRYLDMTARVCEQAGVPLVLMTQPSLYKESMSEAERGALWMDYLNSGELRLSVETLQLGMATYNDAIRTFARERGLILVDLERAVPKELDYMFDDCHYTARANELIASTIVAALREQGLRGLPTR